MARGIATWVADEIKTEQANVEAELATRLIVALSGANRSPKETDTYYLALDAMKAYLTKSVAVDGRQIHSALEAMQ